LIHFENILYAVLGCAITACAIPVVLKFRITQLLLDQPNHRSLHSVAMPRIGGLVFIPVSFCLWITTQFNAITSTFSLSFFALSLLLILITGALDDRLGLTALKRLAVQFVAAGLSWFAVVQTSSGSFGFPNTLQPWFIVASLISILIIVWSINLVNFMDGANGLVASVCFVGLVCLSFLVPDQKVKLLIFALVGSLVGFLYFNVIKVKVFMGDAGSTSLGLIAGSLCIWGIHANHWDWTFALFSFGPLFFDATLTLVHRMVNREKFWEAHRSHLYQRLIYDGNFSHRRVSACYSLACATGFLVLCVTLSSPLLMRYSVATLIAVTYICTYYILIRWISAKKRNFWH
jgi:UDP-N-acetylmuramyl pentapeptide phosphotransferase/UDP-N-acetylglucosamine-1-phosphate transferase